jgi:hypothetical protein
MTYLVLGLFVFFTILSIITRRFGFLSTALGFGVIILSRSYFLLWGSDYEIWTLLSFLPLGLLSFYLSLVLSNLSFRVLGNYFPPKKVFWDYLIIDRFTAFQFFALSFYEELLWRGTPYVLFANYYWGMGLSALLFTLIHLNKRRDISLLKLADIFVFSMFQGFLMISFRNIYLLMLIHAVRNLLIYHWALYKSTRILCPET